MNPEKIEENITEKTKAIIPVHTFGQPADMDKILKIAQNHGLNVIEDAACALGARYKNKYAGIIGDIGCYSFHARKGITTGEGGMVVTNNKDLAEKIRYMSVFGMKSSWEREKDQSYTIPEFFDVGYNYKMSDITAAVGVAQMRKLAAIIEKKRDLAKNWDEQLEDIDLIEKPYVVDGVEHIYQSYVTVLDRQINRNKLIVKLMEQGVQTQIGTYASHIQPVYNSNEKCPNSLDLFNRSLALPMFYALKNEEIDAVAKLIKKTLGELI